MDEKMLNVLRCPKCGGTLEHRAANDTQPEGLYCAESKLLYPLRDGIPILLIEQAIEIPA